MSREMNPEEAQRTSLQQTADYEPKGKVRKRRERGTGSIYRQPGSKNYWIQYYVNGKPYRESSGTDNKTLALRKLRKKLGEIASGRFIEPKAEKTLLKELAEDVFRDYGNNELKSLEDAKTRWRLHLAPVFAERRAASVQRPQLSEYIEKRKAGHAASATINRELALLKRMYSLGVENRKVFSSPKFPHLKENNVRKGFLDSAQYEKLAAECAKEGLWMRALLEFGYQFGWRKDSEVLRLRVEQVDLHDRSIRLEPGTTKNDDGREAYMPELLYQLIQRCVVGKQPTDYIFTRQRGKPVRDFRGTWAKVCVAAGVGRMVSKCCRKPLVEDKCEACGKSAKEPKNKQKYVGLIFHDLRRTAVRNMVRRGIPESVAMKISGHKTRAVFERYNITSKSDLREAARKMDQNPNDSTMIIVKGTSGGVAKPDQIQ